MAERISLKNGIMRLETCYKCGTPFAMSEDVYQMAQARKGDLAFYCPNGHGQVYSVGESEAEKLRRERDQLTQRIAQKDDEIRMAWATANQQAEYVKMGERRLAATKGQVTKLKNRARAGLCPCCNRPFENLQRHMATKHPGFMAEPTADEHVH